MHIEFTQADESHLDALVELINSAYRGESSKQGWTTEEHLLGGQRVDRASLLAILNKPDAVILIAEDDEEEELLGCVQLEKHENKCYLGMLTVNPALQNKGIGKMLLRESEAFCEFWDCNKIYMTVITVREELISWYIKHGYKDTKEKKPFPYGDERFGIPKREDLEFTVLEKKI